MSSAPLADIVDEARRVAAAADESGVLLRPIGGVAVRLHVNGAMRPALERTYRDIDLVSSRKAGKDATRLLSSLGYEPNERFNAMSGGDAAGLLRPRPRPPGRRLRRRSSRCATSIAVGERLQRRRADACRWPSCC